ncbi:MAG: SUMF1/EgtB/PvdO family nonheme iron enzyme [Saprospiraceae bacterium]
MKSLSSLSIILLAIILITSCGKKESGQLTGVQSRPKWGGFNPFGMVYVPSGTLTVGQSDQDVFSTYAQKQKSLSISGFYMDDTEITNNEYRQFVDWVRDSTALELLGEKEEDDFGNETLIWDVEIDYDDETLDEMYYQGDMAYENSREIAYANLKYKYQWIDWTKAANDKTATRKSIINKAEVKVYPDTLCWIRDFTYSYNEPQTRNYFWHPAFDDYPVVGVTWKQANAFCHWRTKLWNKYKGDEPNSEAFRLPSEYEWEYAARGGHDISPYPWGGPYIRNAKGCLLANFKPGRGNYPEDGGMHTVKADAYFPNDYGLFNMAGNAAEWTASAFHDNANNHVHDLNSDYRYDAADSDPEAYKRKVIRGGSWKDISYYCQTSTRTWEFQDTSKSYIGFRCVITYLGRSINDF